MLYLWAAAYQQQIDEARLELGIVHASLGILVSQAVHQRRATTITGRLAVLGTVVDTLERSIRLFAASDLWAVFHSDQHHDLDHTSKLATQLLVVMNSFDRTASVALAIGQCWYAVTRFMNSQHLFAEGISDDFSRSMLAAGTKLMTMYGQLARAIQSLVGDVVYTPAFAQAHPFLCTPALHRSQEELCYPVDSTPVFFHIADNCYLPNNIRAEAQLAVQGHMAYLDDPGPVAPELLQPAPADRWT